MDIYLIRHGQTIWNKEDRLQGWKNSPLSPEGRAQTQALAQDLATIPFDAAFSSDLGRARDTARIILEGRGIQVQERRALRELSLGPWEGRVFEEIKRDQAQALKTYLTSPQDHKLQGGETYQDLLDRLGTFLEELRGLEASSVLVVAHGVSLAGLVNLVEERPLENFWERPLVPGLGLVHILREEGGFRVLDHVSPPREKSY